VPVHLDVLLRPEGGEHLVALLLGELVERQLVVVPHEVRPLAVLRDLREGLQRALEGHCVLPRQREEHRLVHRERQHHLKLVPVLVAEELTLLGRREVHLAQQHRVTPSPPDVAAKVTQELVRVVPRARVVARRLDQEGHRVDAEAAQPLFEPEADRLRDLVPHLGVRDVQIRLVRIEPVQVPLARLLVECPVRVLLVREGHVTRLLLGLLVPPDVEVVIGRVGAAPGVLEPGMLYRGVVHHEIGDHPDAALARRANHVEQVAVRAEPGIYAVEVGDVVAVVALAGRHERHQPYAVDPEPPQVVDAVA
jgi:hypothetical protein